MKSYISKLSIKMFMKKTDQEEMPMLTELSEFLDTANFNCAHCEAVFI